MIPCHIHLVWYPGKPLKVKYHCQELQTPEEASGTEEGSAVAPTELSNFWKAKKICLYQILNKMTILNNLNHYSSKIAKV